VKKITFSGTLVSVCIHWSSSCSSACRLSGLTCYHLPPALIQVRGNHVPHGYRRAPPVSYPSCLRVVLKVGGEIRLDYISSSLKYPNRSTGWGAVGVGGGWRKRKWFLRRGARLLALLRVFCPEEERRTAARRQLPAGEEQEEEEGEEEEGEHWAWFTAAGHTHWESSLV